MYYLGIVVGEDLSAVAREDPLELLVESVAALIEQRLETSSLAQREYFGMASYAAGSLAKHQQRHKQDTRQATGESFALCGLQSIPIPISSFHETKCNRVSRSFWITTYYLE